MTKESLKSYRLSSMEEPTDEMLHAIMEQVAISARKTSEKVRAEIQHRLDLIKQNQKKGNESE